MFNRQVSIDAKNTGMAAAAEAKAERLNVARQIALYLGACSPDNTCTADAVGKELRRRGLDDNLGPAAGSIFKDGNWEFTGERILSSRKSNHARELKVWRLQ